MPRFASSWSLIRGGKPEPPVYTTVAVETPVEATTCGTCLTEINNGGGYDEHDASDAKTFTCEHAASYHEHCIDTLMRRQKYSPGYGGCPSCSEPLVSGGDLREEVLEEIRNGRRDRRDVTYSTTDCELLEIVSGIGFRDWNRPEIEDIVGAVGAQILHRLYLEGRKVPENAMRQAMVNWPDLAVLRDTRDHDLGIINNELREEIQRLLDERRRDEQLEEGSISETSITPLPYGAILAMIAAIASLFYLCHKKK